MGKIRWVENLIVAAIYGVMAGAIPGALVLAIAFQVEGNEYFPGGVLDFPYALITFSVYFLPVFILVFLGAFIRRCRLDRERLDVS